MADSQRKKFRDRDLPAPYISPWLNLGNNFIAIGSYLKLKVIELNRRNYQNDLPTPYFLNKSVAVYFWPTLLLTPFIIITFYLCLWNIDLSHDPKIVESKITDKSVLASPEDVSLVNSFTKKISIDPNPLVIDLPEYFQFSPYEPDPSFIALLVSGDAFTQIEKNLFIGADRTTLDNAVVLKISSTWRNLDITSQQLVLQKLNDRSEEFGYGSLYVIDEDNHLLARKSRVGTGMLLLHEGGT